MSQVGDSAAEKQPYFTFRSLVTGIVCTVIVAPMSQCVHTSPKIETLVARASLVFPISNANFALSTRGDISALKISFFRQRMPTCLTMKADYL